MRFEAVIFDNDGVLVDTAEIAATAFVRVLAEYGVAVSAREADEFFGSSMPVAIATVESRTGRRLPADIVDRFHDEIEVSVSSQARPIAGVEDLLGSLAVPIAVASNGTRSRIEASLRCAGLWTRFEGRVFSAWDVPRRKPAPDVYLAAAVAIGVRPAACAVIEDSPEGVEAAAAAGMTAIGFASSPLPGAAFTVADMLSLRELLGSAGDRPGDEPQGQ